MNVGADTGDFWRVPSWTEIERMEVAERAGAGRCGGSYYQTTYTLQTGKARSDETTAKSCSNA